MLVPGNLRSEHDAWVNDQDFPCLRHLLTRLHRFNFKSRFPGVYTKFFSLIRATGVKWWIEIDLEREPSAGGPSPACSAGPVHPMESGVRSLCSSRQGLSRMPKIVEFVQCKLKLRPI